jgi:hypothetical protein
MVAREIIMANKLRFTLPILAAFAFIPDQVLSFYGAAPDALAHSMTQLFGAAVLGFVVALITQLGGGINALGWSTVIFYLLFALGFGYFRFIKSAA